MSTQTVSDRAHQALVDAMERLVQGRPRVTDGAMTKENLYREAGVSRATMNRDTEVMTAWDEHVAAHGRRTVGEARRDADLAELARKLKAKTAECTELQRRLDAAAGVIAALHHDNHAMAGELARLGATTVTALRR